MQIPDGTAENNLTGRKIPATPLLCKKKRKTGAFQGELAQIDATRNEPSAGHRQPIWLRASVRLSLTYMDFPHFYIHFHSHSSIPIPVPDG